MSGVMGAQLSPVFTLGFAPPADNVASAAIGGTVGAWIFGALSTNSAVGVNEDATISVETGAGTNVYTQVEAFFEPLGSNSHTYPFMFFVPTGRRWKWHDTQGNPLGNISRLVL